MDFGCRPTPDISAGGPLSSGHLTNEATSSGQKIWAIRPVTAVLIGAAVGNALSYVVLLIFGLVFLWVLVAHGVPGNESYARTYGRPKLLSNRTQLLSSAVTECR